MQLLLKIMFMTLKNLSKIKNELKGLFQHKEILDLIIFGSFVKNKPNPNDIDIALIVKDKSIDKSLLDNKNYHFSLISIDDFFKNSISLTNTLFREGYSLKHNKNFSELFNFANKVLFSYELLNLSNSNKVKIVNMFHGKKNKGLVELNEGKWISRQVFIIPVKNEKLFEDIFLNFNCKFKKSYILIH